MTIFVDDWRHEIMLKKVVEPELITHPVCVDGRGDAPVEDSGYKYEQMTAFQTVLEEEIDFPVPATLLGNPVVVTGLVEDDVTCELRARCKGQHAKGLASFADLEFRSGTIEAWLHAAYATYLGRTPSAVTPPAGWDGLARW